jgi:hypothetical protein
MLLVKLHTYIQETARPTLKAHLQNNIGHAFVGPQELEGVYLFMCIDETPLD